MLVGNTVCKVYFGLTAFGGVISGTTVSHWQASWKGEARGDVRRIDKSWPGRTEGEEDNQEERIVAVRQ